MNANPTCLTPISSTNLPATTVKPALTVLECQLGPAFAKLKGAHKLYLNGKEFITIFLTKKMEKKDQNKNNVV